MIRRGFQVENGRRVFVPERHLLFYRGKLLKDPSELPDRYDSRWVVTKLRPQPPHEDKL